MDKKTGSGELKWRTPGGKISAKDAAVAAAKYLKEITGNRATSVEEVELSEDGTRWSITLGYYGGPDDVPVFNLAREYKVFEIDVSTGEVLSMKVRKV